MWCWTEEAGRTRGVTRSLHALAILALLAGFALGSAAGPLPPKDLLGFEIGEDRKLADWRQITAYFHHLNRSSRKLRLVELGPSTLGRPMLMAIITSQANLARLDDHRNTQRLLADPRLAGRSAEELVGKGRAVVLVTCGIHSTEVGSPLLSMDLAYQLVTAEDPTTLAILDKVIVLLVPSLNPDGLDLVTDWYRKTVGTSAEGTSPPELYHPYAGHDNNRDWFMFTQKETRLVVEKVHNVWHPQIVMDLHQMGVDGPRIFVPPYTDPIDPNVDPILRAKIVELGSFIFSQLVTSGKPGILTKALFDAYTPSRAYQHYHAGVRILVEVASARLATPYDSVKTEKGSGFTPSAPSWNYPLPWTGGRWRLADIVDYERQAVLSCLKHAASFREDWLRAFHQVGRNAVASTSPHAFVVPPDQADQQALGDLLSVLRLGQVEVQRARTGFTVERSTLVSPPYGEGPRKEFPAGSYVILLGQPYRAFAKTMLELARYPDVRDCESGGLARPYDVTAHSLGILLGVEVHQVDQPFSARLEPVDHFRPSGSLTGSGAYWLFPHASNAFARLANRLLAQGASLSWAPNGFQADGVGYETGTMMARLRGQAPPAILDGIPVDVRRVERAPQLAWQEVRPPKIGIYASRAPVVDEGWLRWVLEQNEFPYTVLRDEDIRQKDLSFYHVIVIPSQSTNAIRQGLPAAYPEALRGGLGDKGIEKLKDYVGAGNVLLLLGTASELAASLGLEAVNRVAELPPSDFYVPGSLLAVEVNNLHPIAYGMPGRAAVMFDDQPVLSLKRALAIARFPGQEILLGGWLTGERHLRSGAALTEVKLGRGYVVAAGFRPHFRAQMRSTYKFLFNTLFYATTIGR